MGYVDLNQNDRTDWVTPPICRELLAEFAPLKLDVCTNPDNPMQAEQFYTPETDGLIQSWECGGLVWCNHPWSRNDSPKWVNRAVEQGNLMQAHDSGELVLLGPSRPDTAWFRNIWGSANVIYFWKGRVTFHHPVSGLPCMGWDKKNKKWTVQPCPVPVQLSYWGARPQKFVETFSKQGGVFADLTR
jgi:phage N-6-adenine-methyltransferase